MTLEELKTTIELNSNKINFLILICKDESSEFIFHQYVNLYAKNNNLNIEFIDDLTQLTRVNLFASTTDSLKILYTDKLDIDYVPKHEIVWVRCKSISTNVKNTLNQYVVQIPKLEAWQIKDFVYSMLPTVSKHELDYLLNTHNNIYNIDNELNKLLCFPDINKIYEQVKSQLYIDTTEYAIFDLINCLLKYDKQSLTNILLTLDNIDIDVFGLIKLLITNFKRIIDIQLAINPTPESVGVTDKQFWAIKKYSCGIYTKNQLIEIYKLLTNCDYFIKSGYVPASIMINYLLINIMTIKERIK